MTSLIQQGAEGQQPDPSEDRAYDPSPDVEQPVPKWARGSPSTEGVRDAVQPATPKEEEQAARLKTIEVYAFVGPAGTGKSQRVSQVAKQYGIDVVIDDGLVVSKGRIMAGKSAKAETNMVRAVRRAIFEYAPHRAMVMKYLAGRAPCRLMVLATSVGMLQKILGKLYLSQPVQIIYITDVATQEEISLALRERREKKQHVVPVARTQIQRNFAGKFVEQLKNLFKAQDEDYTRTVVKPPFSFDGRICIAAEALRAICQRLIMSGKEIHKLHDLELKAEDEYLDVNVVIDVRIFERSALEVAKRLQKKVSVGMGFLTGMEVKRVNVKVNEMVL